MLSSVAPPTGAAFRPIAVGRADGYRTSIRPDTGACEVRRSPCFGSRGTRGRGARHTTPTGGSMRTRSIILALFAALAVGLLTGPAAEAATTPPLKKTVAIAGKATNG